MSEIQLGMFFREISFDDFAVENTELILFRFNVKSKLANVESQYRHISPNFNKSRGSEFRLLWSSLLFGG